jgi:hypothetical protein
MVGWQVVRSEECRMQSPATSSDVQERRFRN